MAQKNDSETRSSYYTKAVKARALAGTSLDSEVSALLLEIAAEWETRGDDIASLAATGVAAGAAGAAAGAAGAASGAAGAAAAAAGIAGLGGLVDVAAEAAGAASREAGAAFLDAEKAAQEAREVTGGRGRPDGGNGAAKPSPRPK